VERKGQEGRWNEMGRDGREGQEAEDRKEREGGCKEEARKGKGGRNKVGWVGVCWGGRGNGKRKDRKVKRGRRTERDGKGQKAEGRETGKGVK